MVESAPRSNFKAIAAMSLNRVIGDGKKLPWHLPEDFKWFKQVTTGHILLMGRKTFESIGRPLPNRCTLVLSRTASPISGVEVVSSIDEVENLLRNDPAKTLFVCGGGEIYRQFLPLCGELLLTLVKREVSGDVVFPPFEQQFSLAQEVHETPDFRILRYVNKAALAR